MQFTVNNSLTQIDAGTGMLQSWLVTLSSPRPTAGSTREPATFEQCPARSKQPSWSSRTTQLLLTTLAYNLLREGYRVLTAADGEAGLALARQELARLDLVVLDLMLPKLSGLQVLRHLRAETDIPILILSARVEEQDKIDGLELGADDYVVKPFALRELLARVRAGVRRRAVPAAQPPSVLFRGPLRIEEERRRVLVGEQEIPLRPKEYGLLVRACL